MFRQNRESESESERAFTGKCFNLGPLLPWSLLIQNPARKRESESERAFTISNQMVNSLKVSLNQKVKAEGC